MKPRKSFPTPERETVTLINAFRCVSGDGTPCGIICVDSQETVKLGRVEYRVSRLKIKPKRCGNFDLAIAGAGDGDVIDACVCRLHRAVAKRKTTAWPELQESLEAELQKYRKTLT